MSTQTWQKIIYDMLDGDDAISITCRDMFIASVHENKESLTIEDLKWIDKHIYPHQTLKDYIATRQKQEQLNGIREGVETLVRNHVEDEEVRTKFQHLLTQLIDFTYDL